MSNLRSLTAALAAASLLGACAGPVRTEFETFAQAGTKYAGAVDKLLVAAGNEQINDTSWMLVEKRWDGRVTEADYFDATDRDVARMEQIGRLRLQSALLARYFRGLSSLATTSAPEDTKAALDGIVSELKTLQKESPQALGAIGQVAISLKVNAALRDELTKRQDVIRTQLLLHEELVDELAKQITGALVRQQAREEDLLVIAPLTSSARLSKPEQWVSTRKRIATRALVVQELQPARSASKELRKTFDALISGEASPARMMALLGQIEQLVAVAETLNT